MLAGRQSRKGSVGGGSPYFIQIISKSIHSSTLMQIFLLVLNTLKDTVRRLGLGPWLEPPYKVLIQQPYWWIRRNYFPTSITREVNGVSSQFIAEHPEDENYHEFESERPILTDILNEVDQTDVFYDIGANIGLYSCLVSKVIPEQRVVAFEPSPIYNKLERNAKLNDLSFNHYQIAVSNSSDTVDFAIDVSDPQARMSTLDTNNSRTDYEIQKVKSRKLDDFVEKENLPTPTIVKIDVEGAEYDVLKGMNDIFPNIEVVYCEIHHSELDSFNVRYEDITGLLKSKGFELEHLHDRNGGSEFVKATHTAMRGSHSD